MEKLKRLLVLMVCLALLSATISSCQNDEESTDNYFGAMQALVDEFEEEAASLGLKGQQPPSERKRELLAMSYNLQATYLDKVRSIEAPPEAEEAHDAYVDALSTVVGTLGDIVGGLDIDASGEEVDAALENHPTWVGSLATFQTACSALRNVGKANGSTVRLLCP